MSKYEIGTTEWQHDAFAHIAATSAASELVVGQKVERRPPPHRGMNTTLLGNLITEYLCDEYPQRAFSVMTHANNDLITITELDKEAA